MTAELRGQVAFEQPGLVVVETKADGTTAVTFTRELQQHSLLSCM